MSGCWDIPSGPTASQKLRQEYSDLMDKWTEYKEKEKGANVMLAHLYSFTFLERTFKSRSYIHVFNEWKIAHKEYLAAVDEYVFLEKLLRSY